jgi:ribosomal protein S6--L-glutamate ligase
MSKESKHMPSVTKRQPILGCIESVSLPELGVVGELAKIDTGAFSGAVHCTDIKIIRRGALRKRVLTYKPLGNKKLATETSKFEQTKVTSATGHKQKRYIIQTTIDIAGATYPITIGLSDRSDLTRSVLIGRRFIRENNMLVDVSINQEQDHEKDLAV